MIDHLVGGGYGDLAVGVVGDGGAAMDHEIGVLPGALTGGVRVFLGHAAF